MIKCQVVRDIADQPTSLECGAVGVVRFQILVYSGDLRSHVETFDACADHEDAVRDGHRCDPFSEIISEAPPYQALLSWGRLFRR
jgi:hypothetical protein